MWMIQRRVLRAPEDGGDAGSAAGGSATPAAAAPTPAAAPASASAAPAAAPAAAAPSAAPAVADPAAAPAADPKGYWPEDWRKTVSKEDAKTLARLERYASPEAALHALIAAQNRIAAGELKPVLGKNATPEQVAEYRQALGIPETADKYDLGKDAAGIPADALAEILKEAHATHQTPEQVKATLRAQRSVIQGITSARAEADIKAQTDGEDALRAEWGPEFRRNISLIHGMLDGAASPALKEAILGGRLADGTPIGSSPEALKFLVGLALIQNPTGVVVPGSDGNQMQGVEDEITKIETTMRTNRAAYNKDEKLQLRYRELLGAREKMRPRAAS